MMGLRRRIARDTRPQAHAQPDPLLAHASEADRRIVERAMPHSMTGAARLLAVIDAVRYCAARDLEGAFVECGVWRGGSVLAMILALQELSAPGRDIHLYDTFEGMTEPTDADVSALDGPALQTWEAAQRQRRRPWSEVFGVESFNEESVRSLLLGAGFPSQHLHFVRGPVEKTLPSRAPERIALLRLDTDWYESTRHELVHLFPRLVTGGVLIVDDYGHWEGARRAVDEYFRDVHPPLLLNRIDYTGRVAVKL